VVEPANAVWLYHQLGSTEKTLIHLAHSDHLVALDRDREQATGETLKFLRRLEAI
jgi:esterase/lipase